MTVTDLVAALRRARLATTREATLQRLLSAFLAEQGIEFEAEARLAPGERIDFLLTGGIGIEAKVKYPRRGIWRQLERYAAAEAITSLVLVTGTALGLPPAINGKPVYFVSIGRGGL